MTKAVVGFAMCGSFCTFSRVLSQLEAFSREYTVIPILSEAAFREDTRFASALSVRERLEEICGCAPLHSLPEVEPIGPKKLLDALVIAPCTGNTLAKLAAGIADGPVTLAAKSHLRNERPLILAVSTNDALAGNAKSIGALLDRKNVYFVPFGQDDAESKPRSMVADFSRLAPTVEAALRGRQLQPILL